MTIDEFLQGWKHFCKCINFRQSALDADAIRFMNEMPSEVAKGLTGPLRKPKVQTCKGCGCTDAAACPGGCHWVEPDLCNRCAHKTKNQTQEKRHANRNSHRSKSNQNDS